MKLLNIMLAAFVTTSVLGLEIDDLLKEVDPSSNRAQSQLQITPSMSYTTSHIRITSYNSTNGTCSGGSLTNMAVGGVQKTLNSGHTYSTNDAGMYAAYNIASQIDPHNDLYFEILNPGNFVTLASQCVAAYPGGPMCSNTDCGWDSTRTWTP